MNIVPKYHNFSRLAADSRRNRNLMSSMGTEGKSSISTVFLAQKLDKIEISQNNANETIQKSMDIPLSIPSKFIDQYSF